MENAKLTIEQRDATDADMIDDSATENAMDTSVDSLMMDSAITLPPVKFYLPDNGTCDYTKWTADQVHQWATNFLPDSAHRLHHARANGIWLQNFHTGKMKTDLLERAELSELFLHLDLVAKSFLLLKPDGRGTMNTLSNLLFSCWDFRVMFDEDGLKDLEKGDRKTMLYIAEIFLRKTDSSVRLKHVLEKGQMAMDVHQLFDAFLENLQNDISKTKSPTHIPLTFLQHFYCHQEQCQSCYKIKYHEDQSGETMRSRNSSNLRVENGSFKQSMERLYAPQQSSGRCECCGGVIKKSLATENIGQYHFMKIHGEKMEDLDFDSHVSFFGASWDIIAMTESGKNKKGKIYVSWIRAGESWIRVVDDELEHRQGQELKDMDIRMMVFKKFE